MKLRALQSAFVNGVYLAGPEVDQNDLPVGQGQTIEVADNFVVNPQVFEVLEPPRGGAKVRYAKLPRPAENVDDGGIDEEATAGAAKTGAAGAK